jgi:pimeloyl-ACP methyl ester carboxylesterase
MFSAYRLRRFKVGSCVLRLIDAVLVSCRRNSLLFAIMIKPVRIVSAAAALAVLAGCAKYSTLVERRPVFREHPLSASAVALAKLCKQPPNNPAEAIGCYLDAAFAATGEIRGNPKNRVAWDSYNFAVGRIIELIEKNKLEPWLQPFRAVGPSGEWTLRFPRDGRPERDPAKYDLVPADRYQFKGVYVQQRSTKPGIGAPIVATFNDGDPRRYDRFAQGKRSYYGVTMFIHFKGREATLDFADPLAVEDLSFAGHRLPVAADFTAPLAVALAKENPAKIEILRLLRPHKFAETARLARLQPYDPRKIPVIFVHGLMDSQATWVPMITALRADPVVRANYQFWFYSYPSGYPYPHSAAIMRRQLDEIFAAYPNHKKVILVGHSMGGIISRTMVTDSGLHLWNRVFTTPPEKTPMSPTARKALTDALIFRSRPEVSRAIFIAAPHRGSDLAANWLGRIGSSLVKAPKTLLKIGEEVRQVVTVDSTAMNLDRMPNSIDTLSPTNRFVLGINELPIRANVPYHSIIGDRGKGGNKDRTKPISSDGVVPYWSSHLEGARSELIVPSDHSAHRNPQAIAEVRRILSEHLRQVGAR